MMDAGQRPDQIFQLSRSELFWACCAALVGSLIIAFLSVNRNFFTFGTETDYIAKYIAEASRVLDGKPLHLLYHPPLYPIVVASVQFVVGDWFATGLLISWASSIVVLVTSFIFFYHLAGPYAAWASLGGLMSSSLFLTSSASATSDVFFLAIYSCCFLLSLIAMQTGSKKVWLFTGAAVGFALLTRSNSPTLLLILGFPFVLMPTLRTRLKNLACASLACLLILMSWGITAKVTGSEVLPQHTHINMARRYFLDQQASGGNLDPTSAKSRKQLENTFTNVKDVLTYDPIHMGTRYVKDFFIMVKRNFESNTLLAFPLSLFALPGVFLLYFDNSKKRFMNLFLVATVAQLALVNYATYESRFYLFAVPVLSAGVGVCFQHVWKVIPNEWIRIASILVLLSFMSVGIKDSFEKTYEELHAEDIELSEAVTVAKTVIGPNELVVSRNNAFPFYVGARIASIPEADSLEELRVWLEGLRDEGTVYVYFGSKERRLRPQLGELRFAEIAPAWLEPIAQSQEPGGWVLYRFDANRG